MKLNKVLWVDDDPMFLDYISESLNLVQTELFDKELISRDMLLNLIFFSNVDDALIGLEKDQQLSSPEISLLVFDQHMPDIKGLDLAKKIKHMQEFSHYRFAMCSSEDDIIVLAEALSLGAVEYIPKQLAVEQIYFTLQYQVQQINHIQRVVDNSRKRIRRALAAGIIASKTSSTADEVLKNMNDLAQRRGESIDTYADRVVSAHNQLASVTSDLTHLIT